MTNEVNPDPDPDPQEGMTDPDIAIDQEVVLTPSYRKGLEKDPYLIPEGLRDHVQQTGDHFIGGEDLLLILQARSPD